MQHHQFLLGAVVMAVLIPALTIPTVVLVLQFYQRALAFSQAQNDALEADNVAKATQITTLERKIEEKDAEIEVLRSEKEALAREKADLIAENSAIKANLCAYVRDFKDLEIKHHKKCEEVRVLTKVNQNEPSVTKQARPLVDPKRNGIPSLGQILLVGSLILTLLFSGTAALKWRFEIPLGSGSVEVSPSSSSSQADR